MRFEAMRGSMSERNIPPEIERPSREEGLGMWIRAKSAGNYVFNALSLSLSRVASCINIAKGGSGYAPTRMAACPVACAFQQ